MRDERLQEELAMRDKCRKQPASAATKPGVVQGSGSMGRGLHTGQRVNGARGGGANGASSSVQRNGSANMNGAFPAVSECL